MDNGSRVLYVAGEVASGGVEGVEQSTVFALLPLCKMGTPSSTVCCSVCVCGATPVECNYVMIYQGNLLFELVKPTR